MIVDSSKLQPPSDDKRWRIVQATMKRNGFSPTALIESLHAVQSAFGYLDEASLRFVAASLHVPLSKVYGVATFYHLFTLKPQGRHSCVLCTGTACYIKGTNDILAAISEEFDVSPGGTTEDKIFSLLTARCIGACGISPSGAFDDEVVGKLTTDIALEKIRRWTRHDA